MALGDKQVLNSQVADGNSDYLIPGAVSLQLKAVQALFTDNGAGSDWLPAVVAISDSGHVFWRACDQGVKVTAGDDAEVSWFPGVKHAAAAASVDARPLWLQILEVPGFGGQTVPAYPDPDSTWHFDPSTGTDRTNLAGVFTPDSTGIQVSGTGVLAAYARLRCTTNPATYDASAITFLIEGPQSAGEVVLTLINDDPGGTSVFFTELYVQLVLWPALAATSSGLSPFAPARLNLPVIAPFWVGGAPSAISQNFFDTYGVFTV